MDLLITTLPKALAEYPILESFYLDKTSMFYKTMTTFPKRLKSRITVIVALEGGNPIGWSWLVSDKKSSSSKRLYHCWVYVSPNYRRKGIGTTLVQVTYELGASLKRPIYCDPHDGKSRAFFKTLPYREITFWDTKRHSLVPQKNVAI